MPIGIDCVLWGQAVLEESRIQETLQKQLFIFLVHWDPLRSCTLVTTSSGRSDN